MQVTINFRICSPRPSMNPQNRQTGKFFAAYHLKKRNIAKKILWINFNEKRKKWNRVMKLQSRFDQFPNQLLAQSSFWSEEIEEFMIRKCLMRSTYICLRFLSGLAVRSEGRECSRFARMKRQWFIKIIIKPPKLKIYANSSKASFRLLRHWWQLMN